MSQAGLRTDDATALPIAEPPASRRRLRGPIQQTIDLLFVDRRSARAAQDDPAYDVQGQPRRRAVRPGAMLNVVV